MATPSPDVDRDLLLFAWGTVPIDDHERIALIAMAFDRPAFNTPFLQESSLPAFRQAIDDSICVLKTGVWRTREGETVRRLPTMNDVTDPTVKAALVVTEGKLIELRTTFDSLLRSGDLTHCGCGKPDCAVYQLRDGAAHQLTTARDAVTGAFRVAIGRANSC
jgi:hypothetical protein